MEAQTEAARAQLRNSTANYRVRGGALRVGNDAIDIAQSVFGADLVPGLGGLIDVAQGHANDYLSGVNRDAYHGDLRSLYVRLLRDRPDLRGQSADSPAVRAELIEAFGSTVPPEDYAVVGTLIDAEMSREIGAIGSELNELRDALATEFDDLGDRVTTTEGDVIRLNGELQTLDGSVIRLRGTVERYRNDLDIVSTVQAELAARQRDVADAVEAQEAKISANETQIARNRREIGRLTQLGTATAEAVSHLARLQRETAALASENAQRIDAVSGVLYSSVDAAGKLDLIQSGAVQVQDREETMAMLETEATINQFESAVATGQNIVAAARSLGLSDEDANRANDALALVQVGVSVARLYAGDPTALISLASSIGVLTGGAPEPDPFQAAVMEQFTLLHGRLDEIVLQIDEVGVRMDTLLVRQARHQAVLLDELAFLGTGIDVIDLKLGYLIAAAQRADIKACRSVGGAHAATFQRRVVEMPTLDGVREVYQEDPLSRRLAACVLELVTPADPFTAQYLHIPASTDLVRRYPTLRSFGPSRGRQSGISSAGSPRCESALLFDPIVVASATRLMLDLEPISYFEDAQGTFRRVEAMSIQAHRRRQEDLALRYQSWNEIVACTIAQQSLITGGAVYGEPVLPVLAAALTERTAPASFRALAREMLSGRFGHLHQNLAAHLVRTGLGGNVAGYTALAEAQTAEEPPTDALARLNRYLALPGIEATWDARRGVGLRLEAELGDARPVLPLPPAAFIQSGALLYPGAVNDLIGLQHTITERQFAYRASLQFTGDLNAQMALDALLALPSRTP